MEHKNFLVEVEKAKVANDGRPSIGPVYRSVFAKDGFPPPIDGMDSCWDVFRYEFRYTLLGCCDKMPREKKRESPFFPFFLCAFIFLFFYWFRSKKQKLSALVCFYKIIVTKNLKPKQV